MNRFAYDNIDPSLSPARRKAGLENRFGGPGKRRKNPAKYDAIGKPKRKARS